MNALMIRTDVPTYAQIKLGVIPALAHLAIS